MQPSAAVCARQHQSEPEEVHWLRGEGDEKMMTVFALYRGRSSLSVIWSGEQAGAKSEPECGCENHQVFIVLVVNHVFLLGSIVRILSWFQNLRWKSLFCVEKGVEILY